MNKFKVEFYSWEKSGLTLGVLYYKTSREAMDGAYGHPWNSVKVYNDEGELIHQNTQKGFESYA
jgi:hypothetical protein